MRRRFAALVAVVALGGTALPSTTTAQVAPTRPANTLADRDGDRIQDTLELRLRRAAPDRSVAVIVAHDGTVTPSRAIRAVGQLGDPTTFRTVPAFATSARPAQIRALSQLGGVRRVELDAAVHATMDAADTDFGTQAARDHFGLTGAGSGICFLDTGITRSHEQFSGTARSFVWRDFVGTGTWPYDDNGHGTHVASIAAGDGVGGTNAARFGGVAPRADLAIGKVLARSGAGTESRVIQGLDWCASQPTVDVVSLSLGLALPSDGTDVMSAAVDALEDRGIVVVVAAGNSGDLPGSIGSPAAAAGAITVGSAADWSAPTGAPNRSEGLYLAPSSSRGPTLDGRGKPDVAGPGMSITAALRATTSGYTTMTGTSMATPFVAGAIALALQARPAWTPDDIRAALTATSIDLGQPGVDLEWGAGALDAYALLARATGNVGTGAMPAHQSVEGSVGSGEGFRHKIAVPADGLDVPIAATIVADGACVLPDPTTSGGCRDTAWANDLVARLVAPDGRVLASSDCPLAGECRRGRQETLHAMPTVAGTYAIEVEPADGASGGGFRLDVSHGPLSALPSAPARPLHVGDLDASRWNRTSTTWRARVLVTVHDADERPVPGAAVVATWDGTFAGSCTTLNAGTCAIVRDWPRTKASARLDITGVTLAGWTFDATAAHDVDGGTNGRTVTVTRP